MKSYSKCRRKRAFLKNSWSCGKLYEYYIQNKYSKKQKIKKDMGTTD